MVNLENPDVFSHDCRFQSPTCCPSCIHEHTCDILDPTNSVQ